MEDVTKLIIRFEGESAGRRLVMQHMPLSDSERLKCEFHLRLNAEIIEALKRFL